MSAPALADPRVAVLPGPLTVEAITGVDPAALAAAGHETLTLPGPVRLGESDEFDVRFVHLLREAISVELRVDWTTGSHLPFAPDLVSHLQPPRRGGGEQWRLEFRYGRCYYRRGPGFVTLKDTRAITEGARYRIEEQPAVVAFAELEGVVHAPTASAGALELAGVLGAEHLVLRRGDWLTVLPFRMRRWPVPFDVV
ncbi:MAG TPA: DUF5825 family protein [Pseudonocardiaceae bacterium]